MRNKSINKQGRRPKSLSQSNLQREVISGSQNEE